MCHCTYTYADLLFIQVCSDATPMHCSTCQSKTASPVFSAALQNRLTAALCHCKYTYGDLLSMQVCSQPTPLQCSTGFAIRHSSLLSAVVQTRLRAALCQMEIHLSILAPFSGLQPNNTNALQHWIGQFLVPTAVCCCANQANDILVWTGTHLWRLALYSGLQPNNTNALQHQDLA